MSEFFSVRTQTGFIVTNVNDDSSKVAERIILILHKIVEEINLKKARTVWNGAIFIHLLFIGYWVLR